MSRDERAIAVVSSSGSDADFRIYDVATCKQRASLDVAGPAVEVTGDVVSHAGDCEMSDTKRGTCWPATVWRLDAACTPVELANVSAAWTRERFGVGFWQRSEIDGPFTPAAAWIGVTSERR